MNQITFTLFSLLLVFCTYGCNAQKESTAQPAKVVTKTKTAQELRQEARQKMLAERNKSYSFMQLDGKKIHYRDEGKGPALVLIHGMGSNLKQWNNYTDMLKDKYRVISMDTPGGRFGSSEAMFARPSTDSIAIFITMMMDELNIDKAHICGSSYGGATAINVAATFPERVEGLILIAAAQALSPLVKDITAPTLIMWGENDPILPLDQANTLNETIKGSVLKVYAGGKHVPTDSHKDETVADIREFLSKI